MEMHKTMIYLPKEQVKALKAWDLEHEAKGLTYQIRQAVMRYLKELKREKKPKEKFATLKKALGSAKHKPWGEDAVAYQRRLREEWD